MPTKIQWTEETWNPVTGCTKVSAGCKNCYAERMAKRLHAMGLHAYRNEFAVTLQPDALDKPFRWKKPRAIFVNSMSDLFHEDVPDEYIDQVFAVMLLTPWHTYQVLTKRAKRMADYCSSNATTVRIVQAIKKLRTSAVVHMRSPREPEGFRLPNVWLGISAENQPTFDERIGHLIRCPAAVRFISFEPLLGPIDTTKAHVVGPEGGHEYEGSKRNMVNWVIVGGESGNGPNIRPMHPDWARSIRDECKRFGTAFFFKQWGEFRYIENAESSPGANDRMERCDDRTATWMIPSNAIQLDDNTYAIPSPNRSTGRLLDGIEHNEFPTPHSGHTIVPERR